MRIAFLDSWLQQVVDGSGTAAAIGGLERALMQRGHTVVRITPFQPWPHTLTVRRLLYNIQLPALLRSLQYDLVVGFDIDGFLWSGKPTATPYVCSIKGVIAEEARHERGGVRALLWSLSRLERINAQWADLVLTTSAYCRRKIGDHYGLPTERVRLVPEGIDLAGWRRVQARLTIPRDPFTVLCVARQYPRKHVQDLLHAFVLVRQRVPRARLVIVGDGPEHARLRHLAAMLHLNAAVVFTGALADDEVVLWYRRSGIFCLPSVQEGFGIVFLEAMASGLPIVSTTAAAIPEVVPHRQAGILVPPAAPVALAAALIELLEQPDVQAQYGAYGAAHVEQYTWDNVADQFLAVVAAGNTTPRLTRPALPAMPRVVRWAAR
ncbi:MAG: glycosyltransferase family 4 protein [Chloroflexaceae bacterium]|nr:glycosyltransferase family 4 protein [Chloroflexaceae bacterium]NJO05276.1 glycosyltransferase family 4 protein [Chloroflexaceae bacterium]